MMYANAQMPTSGIKMKIIEAGIPRKVAAAGDVNAGSIMLLSDRRGSYTIELVLIAIKWLCCDYK